jgi:hypothetical protein
MKHDREYFRVHAWLIYWHGRATKCENKDCTHKNPKRFEWALLHDKKCNKSVDNFIQFCCSCHRKYDFKEETRQKMSKARKGRPAHNKTPVILNDIHKYPSITIASIDVGISISSIHNNLKGLSKSTKIGKWKYQQMN